MRFRSTEDDIAAIAVGCFVVVFRLVALCTVIGATAYAARWVLRSV